ncbi:MAG: hypothetical protein A3G35_05870 [candidate division NC10 bacterium RIFCSPLOWO2_12_FULL_66_18]|nr:MAG: hypothetical protein A3G35_05870 [candidate division NC10 bacterium RIFCSPLOWO2_12_FULL_66_18]
MIREAEGPALAIFIAVFLRTAACIRSRQAPEIARMRVLTVGTLKPRKEPNLPQGPDRTYTTPSVLARRTLFQEVLLRIIPLDQRRFPLYRG